MAHMGNITVRQTSREFPVAAEIRRGFAEGLILMGQAQRQSRPPRHRSPSVKGWST